jgi:hypothetical protein
MSAWVEFQGGGGEVGGHRLFECPPQGSQAVVSGVEGRLELAAEIRLVLQCAAVPQNPQELGFGYASVKVGGGGDAWRKPERTTECPWVYGTTGIPGTRSP